MPDRSPKNNPMPTDYKKLTPAQRQEIVAARQARGYSLHASTPLYRPEGCHLITAANFEHAMIMASSERKTEFERLLLEAFQKAQAEVIAWVVLPNHYHILANIASLEVLAPELKSLHGATSRQWNIEDGQAGQRRVWFKYTDRLMRNENQMEQAFNYIHFNPIKHEYVDKFGEWPWSSYSYYEETLGEAWLQEHWQKNIPQDDFGKEWDEKGFIVEPY